MQLQAEELDILKVSDLSRNSEAIGVSVFKLNKKYYFAKFIHSEYFYYIGVGEIYVVGGQNLTSARKSTSNLQSLPDHPFVISVRDIYIEPTISLFHEQNVHSKLSNSNYSSFV